MSEKNISSTSNDFRGLTIFEILIILSVILGSILWALSVRSNMQNKIYDAQRKGKVSTLREHLMTLVNSNGSFPSDEQFLNDDSRKIIFSEFLTEHGQDALNDPKDKDLLISYIAEPEECSGDVNNPCTKVTIGLQLSTGEQFIKFGVQPGKEAEYLNQLNQEDGTL